MGGGAREEARAGVGVVGRGRSTSAAAAFRAAHVSAQRFSNAPTILLVTSSKKTDAAAVYKGDRNEKSTENESHVVSGDGPSSNVHSLVRW